MLYQVLAWRLAEHFLIFMDFDPDPFFSLKKKDLIFVKSI